jgi:hypothetical protein
MATAYKPINGGGIQLRPFNTHKRWVVTDINQRSDSYLISVIKGISPNFGEKINVSESISLPAYRETDQIDNSSSGNTSFLKSKHQKVIWSGLNQMFFKHRPRVERDLYASASIFSIPQNRLGDGIKCGTVEVVDTSMTSSNCKSIIIKDKKADEYHGHLYDDGLDTGSYVPFGNLVGYWGFNDEVVSRYATYDDVIEDRSGYLNNGFGLEIDYIPGIYTSGDFELPSGTMAGFNGLKSYIRIDHKKQYDFFATTDYSLSVWATLPATQSEISSTTNTLVSKRGTHKDYGQDEKLNHVLRRRNIVTPQYPFNIEVLNQTAAVADRGKVNISLSNGLTTVEALSTTRINDKKPNHICFNKTGETLELWINGVKESSGTLPTSGSNKVITLRGIANDNDIVLGSRTLTDGWAEDRVSSHTTLSGSLDEFRIYNKALSTEEIKSLSNNDYITGSAFQTNVVGEVFYNHGIMVVSDPRPKYRYIWTGQNGTWNYGSEVGTTNVSKFGYATKYKSSKTLHELNILCEVGSNEFNVSQNPTLKLNNNVNSSIMKGFVTGSDFKNYFTTLGLYNPNGDLIAVGKLASAIQNRNDVDITVKVRLDLDGPFGAPGTGSLMSGRTATITEVKDTEGNSKFVWGKLDRPDILVDGDFGEAFETQSLSVSAIESADVLPSNDPLPTSPVGGINGSYNPPR